MYVDKRLDGVQAVQTLSRLNRTAADKVAPFVLDFVNDPEDIRAVFEPYYDQTQLLDGPDPYRLNQLQHQLDQTQVCHQAEVDEFAKIFNRPLRQQRSDDHARLEQPLQPACDRFDTLDEDQQPEFPDRLAAFVSLYTFLSQIIPYADSNLECLYAFGKALLPRLNPDRDPVRLGDDVELEFCRLPQVSSGVITLGEEDIAVYPPMSAPATPKKRPLCCRRSSSTSTTDSAPTSPNQSACSSNKSNTTHSPKTTSAAPRRPTRSTTSASACAPCSKR